MNRNISQSIHSFTSLPSFLFLSFPYFFRLPFLSLLVSFHLLDLPFVLLSLLLLFVSSSILSICYSNLSFLQILLLVFLLFSSHQLLFSFAPRTHSFFATIPVMIDPRYR